MPSSAVFNPGLRPTQVCFSPFNGSQLHGSATLPRIIVAVHPNPSFSPAAIPPELKDYTATMFKINPAYSKLRLSLNPWEPTDNRSS